MLTVIIPTYNSGKTLKNCLESLLKQTFKNYDVIVVDGKSTDDTIQIIASYKKKFPKFTWICEPDKGVYDAMNKGIELATEGYLYFMGSDDTIYTDSVFQELVANNYFGSKDVIYGQVFSEKDQELYAGEFTYLKLYNQNICHQAIFIKKEVFKILGDYNLKYNLLSDWDHNIRWFYSNKTSHVYIDLIVAHYAYGGLSYQSRDEAFRKDKSSKFLKRGLGKLPLSVLSGVYLNEIQQHHENYNYIQLFGLRLIHFIFKALLFLKRIF